MSIDSWVIITDQGRAGGMLSLARGLAGSVTAVVAGPRSLADSVAGLGFSRVLCFETAAGTPPESLAPLLIGDALLAAPRLVVSSDAASSRVLLGCVAAALNAAVISSVREVSLVADQIVAGRSTAEGRLLEDIAVPGALAAIFDGDDAAAVALEPVEVEMQPTDGRIAELNSVGMLEVEGGTGLEDAARVVGVGVGLGSKDGLGLIEELVDAAHAELACTLPVSEDMRWLPASRVVGSSHKHISPALYIAVGISGQPQHLAGVRDSKVLVAVNNDPDARIFKHCDYGIIGDLYNIVPALIAEFKTV